MSLPRIGSGEAAGLSLLLSLHGVRNTVSSPNLVKSQFNDNQPSVLIYTRADDAIDDQTQPAPSFPDTVTSFLAHLTAGIFGLLAIWQGSKRWLKR